MPENFQLTSTMNAARAYTRYLNARIRVERLNRLLSEHPSSLAQNNQDRLPAGGRIMPSGLSLSILSLCPVDSASCVCDKSTRSSTENPLKKKKDRPKKIKDAIRMTKDPQTKFISKSTYKCKCKYPIIVVPSMRKLENKKKEKTAKRKPVNQLSNKAIRSAEPKLDDIIEPVKCITECTEYEKIRNMSNELDVLKNKLENQVVQDINQNEQFNELNDKVKQLHGIVNTLNNMCKNLESANDKSTKERQDVKCECGTNKSTAKSDRLEIKHALERKTSSLCQFCKNKKLPLLGSMKDELSKMMGDLTVRDVVLTILLRPDNIYHVNLREMETGGDLGCVLVNYDGIQEANNLGLFKEILTICVTDVRNTIESKEAIRGVINFEFIKVERLRGGTTLRTKPYEHGLPKSSTHRTPAQATFECSSN